MTEQNHTTMHIGIDHEYNDFTFQAFGFERVIYLYVWVVLVVMTLIVNLFVSIVLTRKALRSATNMLLVAIAITDSLTGLVTLPSYMMVYASYQSAPDVDYAALDVNPEYEYYYDGLFDFLNYTYPVYEYEQQEAYLLSKPLCEAFMLSKFYFSRIFHTMSIWLTLYLGLQRFICVKFSFTTQIWFTKKTHIIVCAGIVLLAPILHIFHLTDEKMSDGMCSWLIEKPCTGSCAHMMTTLLFMHLIPCVALTATTFLLVHQLHSQSGTENNGRRTEEENRKYSIIVIAIAVVFLIPEMPYAIFLIYIQILANTELRSSNSLRVNRIMHTSYELCTVLSFNANFYIYTFLNKRFRRELRRLLACRREPMPSTKGTSFSCEPGTGQMLTEARPGESLEMNSLSAQAQNSETGSGITLETPNDQL